MPCSATASNYTSGKKCEHASRLTLIYPSMCGVVQANKEDAEQPMIADVLPPFTADGRADVCVVGCGPAGLALAGALAARGVDVALVGEHATPWLT